MLQKNTNGLVKCELRWLCWFP